MPRAAGHHGRSFEESDRLHGSPASVRGARGVLLGVARATTVQAVGAATILVLGNRVTPAEFAVYAGVNFLLMATYTFIAESLTWTLVRTRERIDDAVLDSAVTLVVAVAIPIVLACGLLAIAGGVAVVTVAGTGVYIALLALRYPASVVLRRDLRVGRLVLIEITDRVLFQAATLTGVFLGNPANGVGAGAASAGIVGVGLSYAAVPWRPHPEWPGRFRRWLSDALRIQGSALLGLLVPSVTVPLVGLLAGSTAAGLYAWAFFMAWIPFATVTAAAGILVGMLARLDRAEQRRATELACRVCAFGVGAALALLVGAAPALIRVAFGSHWRAAVGPLIVLAVGVYFAASMWAVVVMLYTIGETLAALRAQAVISMLSLGAAALLTPETGAIGMALAVSGGQVLFAVVAARLARHARGVGASASLARAGIASTIAGGAGYLAAASTSSGPVNLGLALAAAATVYAALVAALAARDVRADARTVARLLRPGVGV